MMRSAENEFEGNDHSGRGVLVRIGEKEGVLVMEGEGEGVGEKELLMVVDEDIRRDHELNRLYTCDAKQILLNSLNFLVHKLIAECKSVH